MPTPFLQDLLCLLGQPVAGNPTQFMMEKAFARHNLDWRYLSFEVPPESLGDAVRGIRALGFRGGNVTKPHKVAVVEFVDRMSDAAAMMGAVNCLVRDKHELVGENTDGKGFLQSLAALVEPAGKQVVILGAGGAARAIAVELALAGVAKLTIVNRSEERGRGLVDLLGKHSQVAAEFVAWADKYEVPAEADVLIQATSIGLNDPDGKVPVNLRHAGAHLVAADVVFNPAETRFLLEARQRGLRVLDGLGMIVNQGAIAFELWTGIEPDTTVMREAVEEFLSL